MKAKSLLLLPVLALAWGCGNGTSGDTNRGGGGWSGGGTTADGGSAGNGDPGSDGGGLPGEGDDDGGSGPDAGGGPGTGGGPDGGGGKDSGGNGGGAGGGSPLAKHLITGYWQDFDNGAKVVSLADVPAGYDLVAVAFANADPSRPGAVTFGIDSGLASALGGYTDAQFKADIQTLHAKGRKVIVSVGGQNGAISVSDATSASNFATSAWTLLQTYGFDGVDIDLENGLTPSAMASALRQLAAKAGPGLVITLAPQTIDMQSASGDYFQLALAIEDILTIVNMQYYNSGSMNGADGNVYSEGSVDFLTALADIQLKGGLRPDQVGLGVPASSSAAGSGYVAPSVVNAALDCLASGTGCGAYKPAAKYPSIRGAMTWSVNWDGSSGYAFEGAVSGHLSSLP